MKLTKLGISKFRSIADAPVTIDLENRLNIIIGPNNSGKSNLFRALENLSEQGLQKGGLNDLDRHMRNNSVNPQLFLTIGVEETDDPLFSEIDGGTFAYSRGENGGDVDDTPFDDWDHRKIAPLYRKVANKQFTRVPDDAGLANARTQLSGAILNTKVFGLMPKIVIVPQFREISEGDAYTPRGSGIVGLLEMWQHPETGSDNDREKFDQVEDFLRKLLHADDISLEVTPQKQIMVTREGLRLPLDSYGTGVHELIIIAIAVLNHRSALICIEEPEIHLHPILQKKLLRFLLDQTTNNYLVTTHSNSFLNASPTANIIHVWMENGITIGRAVKAPNHALEAIRDLGYVASDLLQSNSIIWVEGPSDRIYLKRWIEIADPNLVEGVNFSIMFYGGRLLSHLTLSSVKDTADDLIELLNMNQFSAIIIDSDRKRSDSEINDTKRRIVAEAEKSGVLCWITEGREIENYVSVDAISQAYRVITGINEFAVTLGKYQCLEDRLKETLGKNWTAKWEYTSSKPKISRKITPFIEDLTGNLDLEEKIAKIVAMIRSANEHF